MNLAIEIVLRTSAILTLTILARWTMRNARPSSRVQLLRLSVVLLVVSPLATLLGLRFQMPNWSPPIEVIGTGEAEEFVAESFPWVIVYVWAVGSALWAIPFASALRRIWAYWNQGQPVAPETEFEIMEVSSQSQYPGSVSARLAEVASPMVYGIWPKLILPPGFSDWSYGNRQVSLKHEFAHLRRRDPAWTIVFGFLSLAYWWNPLFAWISRLHRVDMELAADESVLAAGVSPSAYANCLISVARNEAPIVSCAMGASHSLETRVQSVVRFANRGRPSAKVGIVIGAGFALAVVGTVGIEARGLVVIPALAPKPLAQKIVAPVISSAISSPRSNGSVTAAAPKTKRVARVFLKRALKPTVNSPAPRPSETLLVNRVDAQDPVKQDNPTITITLGSDPFAREAVLPEVGVPRETAIDPFRKLPTALPPAKWLEPSPLKLLQEGEEPVNPLLEPTFSNGPEPGRYRTTGTGLPDSKTNANGTR